MADLRDRSEPDEYKDLTESGDLIRTEEDDACDEKWNEEDEVPPTLLWYLWCVFREGLPRIFSALSLLTRLSISVFVLDALVSDSY